MNWSGLIALAKFVIDNRDELKRAGVAVIGLSKFIHEKMAVHGATLTPEERAELHAAIHALIALELDHSGGATGLQPPPEVPPADPTTVEYDTLEDAIAHLAPGLPFVRKKTNGKFTVWPAISVFDGVKVYPPETSE